MAGCILAVKNICMKTYLLSAIACFLYLFAAAQDSIIVYHTGGGHVTSNKDSASTYTVFTNQGKQWYGRTYYVKNNVLESHGSFSEMNLRKPVGTFDNYTDSGILRSTYVYDKNSEMKSMTQYYRSGKKYSYIEWKRNGKVEQSGWDEEGNVIPGFIVQQEAEFPGGISEWRRYLQKNLDTQVPEKNNVKPGRYTVMVSFRIDKEGKITEVKAENIPDGCVPCAVEAVRVIQEGPDWQAAIQNNKPVIYRQRQSISFVVEEETRNRRQL